MAVRTFIRYLDALDGEDKDLGSKASENFNTTLSLLKTDYKQGICLLAYDIGGKGVLDRRWSDLRMKEIEKITDEIYRIIYAKWWQFWK
ncbi:MAG: hypothetical protein RL693_993 [Verrucomicrobiota bacterium]